MNIGGPFRSSTMQVTCFGYSAAACETSFAGRHFLSLC